MISNVMRWAGVLFALAASLAALSCGTSNIAVSQNGTVQGAVNIAGPINGAVDLQVGLFSTTGDTPLQSAAAGHVTTVATATLAGRAITFSFTEVPAGTYRIRVYAEGPVVNTYYFNGDSFTTTSAAPDKNLGNLTASFSGDGPFGTVSGLVLLEGNTTFPDPATILTFVGFSPVDAPQNVLQWLVSDADVQTGEHLAFNVDGIAYGTWNVGFYGYNPVTHAVFPYGALDAPVTVSAAHPLTTGAVFPADFDGDPGTDAALGVISGTITFSAFTSTIPASSAIFVAANTIPPQQGAPLSSFDVAAADIDPSGTLNYTLPALPNGDYGVAIFVYDFATHTATYFGSFPDPVTVSDATPNVEQIDFNSDPDTAF